MYIYQNLTIVYAETVVLVRIEDLLIDEAVLSALYRKSKKGSRRSVKNVRPTEVSRTSHHSNVIV
jgi:hypothetical protein